MIPLPQSEQGWDALGEACCVRPLDAAMLIPVASLVPAVDPGAWNKELECVWVEKVSVARSAAQIGGNATIQWGPDSRPASRQAGAHSFLDRPSSRSLPSLTHSLLSLNRVVARVWP